MSLINNAIGWANFQMSGGVKRVAWICAGIAIVLPLVIFGAARLEPSTFERSLRNWLQVLGVIQGGLLLFGLPSRVHAAIRRDRLTTKILESHRLMPVPATHAVAGYIVGPNVLFAAVIATIFAVGLLIAAIANQDWRGWVTLHVAGVGIAGTLCCLVAFMSQWVPRLNPALLLLIFGPMIGSAMAALLPGFRVMFAPFLARLPELQRGEVPGAVVVSALAQCLFALILFVGASRRYRRDDVPALGLGWGLALLSLWIGLTIVGARFEETFRFSRYDRDEESMTVVAFVMSTAFSMLLSIGPIAGAATAIHAWRDRRRIDPYFNVRRPPGVVLATVGTIAVLSLLLLAPPLLPDVSQVAAIDAVPADTIQFTLSPDGTAQITPVNPPVTVPAPQVSAAPPPPYRYWAATLGVIATFAVTVAMLAHAAARLKVPALVPIIVWIVLSWAIPPMADGISAAMSDAEIDFPRAIGAVSPPFTLAAIWTARLDVAMVGLIAQIAALPLLYLAWQFVKRHNRGGTPPTSLVEVPVTMAPVG